MGPQINMFYSPPQVRLHEQSGLFVRSDGMFCRTETGTFVCGCLKNVVQKSRKGTKPKLYYQCFTTRWWYVHRLVAACFCENPCRASFFIVDHIDGDQKNNASSNLRWCTQSINLLNRTDAKNYTYNKKWKKFLVSVVVNGDKMMGGSYKTETEAKTNSKIFKADLFRALYKSYVTNETETTRACENIHGPQTSTVVVPKLPHTRTGRYRELRAPRFVLCC
jgi:hypothetical protein